MNNTVFCKKLMKELPALENAPFPGPFGEKILQSISAQAWEMWVNHQTMLINEYRLSMIDPQSRSFLREEMEKFLFGEGAEKPSGFVPEQS
jgi:Fe-S cluster biosynthesis and repair protein YggX